MDVGLLAGESLSSFSAPPGFLPLFGGQSTPSRDVSAEFSRLFSAVEPNGSEEDILVPLIMSDVLWHVGFVLVWLKFFNDAGGHFLLLPRPIAQYFTHILPSMLSNSLQHPFSSLGVFQFDRLAPARLIQWPLLPHDGIYPLPFILDPSVVDVATSPLTEYSDLGETSKEGDQQEGESGLDGAGDAENGEVGDFGYYEVVQCSKEIFLILGISHGGNEKKLLDLLTILEEEQCPEVLVSPSKPKERRELKNFECSINFDARGDCSNRGKGKRVLSMF